MTRILVTFGEDGSPRMEITANFMQVLAVADLLRMEGEVMYMNTRVGEVKPDKAGGKVIDIARGMPGMPRKES